MVIAPFPWILAELAIFILFVQQWGFLKTMGFYFLPCLLGGLILATIGRMGLFTLQSALRKGQLPASRILHTGAIFVSGLLLIVPSFFTRVFGLILLLPGLRHLFVWWFKIFIAKKMASGSSRIFRFGNANFGFGGFGGFPGQDGFSEGFESKQERDVTSDPQEIDVTPLQVTHETKDSKSES